MRNISILLTGAALALAGAATPGFARSHHRHMASSSLHHPSTPAERQQTEQLNRQQLAQAQNTAAGTNAGMAATGAGGDNTAVSNNANGTATQQNGLTTEPANYQRMRGNSGTSTNGAAGSTDTTGTAAGTGAAEGEQVGSPMNSDTQGNPSGAVSPPPAGPSSTPQQ